MRKRIPLAFLRGSKSKRFFFDVIESDMKNRFTVAIQKSLCVFAPYACGGVFILRAQAIIKYQN